MLTGVELIGKAPRIVGDLRYGLKGVLIELGLKARRRRDLGEKFERSGIVSRSQVKKGFRRTDGRGRG